MFIYVMLRLFDVYCLHYQKFMSLFQHIITRFYYRGDMGRLIIQCTRKNVKLTLRTRPYGCYPVPTPSYSSPSTHVLAVPIHPSKKAVAWTCSPSIHFHSDEHSSPLLVVACPVNCEGGSSILVFYKFASWTFITVSIWRIENHDYLISRLYL